jgi:hypothetical protein
MQMVDEALTRYFCSVFWIAPSTAHAEVSECGGATSITALLVLTEITKALLPSRVLRGIVIPAAWPPQLSSRGAGGPPGAVWP